LFRAEQISEPVARLNTRSTGRYHLVAGVPPGLQVLSVQAASLRSSTVAADHSCTLKPT